MKIIDGHSHIYQVRTCVNKLKKSINEIEGFDLNLLLQKLDEIKVCKIQTMPQDMTRIRGQWLGSNELSAEIQQQAPRRIISFAASEPLDENDNFNSSKINEIEKGIVEKGLKGLLLTPPYGHYYSNDKRIYPVYEKAVELDIPIYFHHSHMFGSPNNCPLKYARIWLIDDIIIDFPELRVNIEHMGYPWTEELLSIMARSPNVYTDVAMFIDPYIGKSRCLLLARNLGMAREYGVLDRIFYGSDYVGKNIDEYVNLLKRELKYIKEKLSSDMKKLGYTPLNNQEINGLVSKNVLKLLKLKLPDDDD